MLVGLSVVMGDLAIKGLPSKEWVVGGIFRPPNTLSSDNTYCRDSIFGIVLLNLKFIAVGAKTPGNTNKSSKHTINEDHADYFKEPLIMILPANRVNSIITYSFMFIEY